MSVETMILSSLIYSEEYSRKILPFLKVEYFSDLSEKIVFELILNYFEKYNSCPTIQALKIDLDNKQVNQVLYDSCKNKINEYKEDTTDIKFKIDNTETFCQEKSIHNALLESIQIIDDKTGKKSKGSIPQLLSDALSVSFETQIGHDYIDDAETRYDYYTKKINKIPFDIDYFNRITDGGLPSKTLTCFLAGTNVGKTQIMCHCAKYNLQCGFNVLYITNEMSQEEIGKRIDANMLDIEIESIKTLSKKSFTDKVEKVRKITESKLIIKEYPTAQAHTGHFRHLLNELKLKKKFIPDIIYIDYINICSSSRIKKGQANSYEYIKSIAEEIRGLAVEYDVPIVTATQLNRGGFSSTDIGLEDTAESFGLPATADLMIGLIITDELEEMGQIMCKQLKNRFGSKKTNTKFVIGVDRSKMRFYDVEQEAQQDISEGPVFDNSNFGGEETERKKPKKKFDKSMFNGFK